MIDFLIYFFLIKIFVYCLFILFFLQNKVGQTFLSVVSLQLLSHVKMLHNLKFLQNIIYSFARNSKRAVRSRIYVLQVKIPFTVSLLKGHISAINNIRLIIDSVNYLLQLVKYNSATYDRTFFSQC